MIPWRAWLTLALSLGVAPETFWRLSVKEWRALAFVRAPLDYTLGRAELEALMQAYPDG